MVLEVFIKTEVMNENDMAGTFSKVNLVQLLIKQVILAIEGDSFCRKLWHLLDPEEYHQQA